MGAVVCVASQVLEAEDCYATTTTSAEAYFSRADPSSREKAQIEPTDGHLAGSLGQVAQKVLMSLGGDMTMTMTMVMN